MSGKRRGRRPIPKNPVWAVDPFSQDKSVTSALISMCIKEDFNQTLLELARKLSELKDRPQSECLAVLRDLKKRGHLGYWDDSFTFNLWPVGKKGKKRNE